MTERIAVNFGLMQDGAAELKLRMRNIDNLLAELDHDAKPLLETWVNQKNSVASASYNQSRAKLQAYVNHISELIGRFGTVTADAADYQQSVENNISKSFSA